MLVAYQKARPASWRPVLAAVGAIVPSGLAAYSNDGFATAARVSAPTARLLLAGQIADQFDHYCSLRSQVGRLRDITADLLSALATVRLIGGNAPQRQAEHVVMVLGEMISAIPVSKDRLIRQQISDSGRYETIRDAVGFHLREFIALARADLSRWPWRRHRRARRWQILRPKALTYQLDAVDVEALIRNASDKPID